jgi:hypothetical protein
MQGKNLQRSRSLEKIGINPKLEDSSITSDNSKKKKLKSQEAIKIRNLFPFNKVKQKLIEQLCQLNPLYNKDDL